MAEPSIIMAWVEKGGIVGLLALNSLALWKFGGVAAKIIMSGALVPKLYYDEKVAECNRLRSENDAYRAITLRAVGVVESAAKRGG
jgi:hypothetical protein